MIENNLRHIMAEYKINDMTELMQTTGLSRNALNKLYKDSDIESIKLETLFKICDTFKIKLSQLIDYIPNDHFTDVEFNQEEMASQIYEIMRTMRKEPLRNIGARKPLGKTTPRNVGAKNTDEQQKEPSDD